MLYSILMKLFTWVWERKWFWLFNMVYSMWIELFWIVGKCLYGVSFKYDTKLLNGYIKQNNAIFNDTLCTMDIVHLFFEFQYE